MTGQLAALIATLAFVLSPLVLCPAAALLKGQSLADWWRS